MCLCYVLILCNEHNFCNLSYVQTIGRRIMFEWVIISWNPAKVVSFFFQAFLTRSEQKEGLFLCSHSFCFEPFLHFLWQWNWIKRRRKQNEKIIKLLLLYRSEEETYWMDVVFLGCWDGSETSYSCKFCDCF